MSDLASAAPGLVVMLDAAGRTIAQLEQRIAELNAALRDAHATIRAYVDTPTVDAQGAPSGHTQRVMGT